MRGPHTAAVYVAQVQRLHGTWVQARAWSTDAEEALAWARKQAPTAARVLEVECDIAQSGTT